MRWSVSVTRSKISGYACEALAWAVDNHIVAGKGSATRAQAAQIFLKLHNRKLVNTFYDGQIIGNILEGHCARPTASR